MDELVVQYLVASYPENRGRVCRSEPPRSGQPVHMALHRSLPAPAYRKIQRATPRDDPRSTYHRLLRGLDRADIDGDGRPEYVARRSGQFDAAQRAYDLFSQTLSAPAPAAAGTGTLFLWRLCLQRLVVGAG
jgi:hypothetical protein